MSGTGAIVTLSPHDYDAVLFDLDGVLTRTAAVHAAAWKRMLDAYLERRAASRGEPFIPFDIDEDYRRYVDGKPRREGVSAFLESRGIRLPHGESDDPPEAETIEALAARKDRYFMEQLARNGVERYASSVALVRALREQGIATAVVSSSRNCAQVLEAADIAALFDTRVDGNDLASLHLAGKPAPDTFLEAARRLRVEPQRAAVVEDAIAGVAAGHAGKFRTVIGVDRHGSSQVLREAGADVVVNDLAQLHLAAASPSEWSLVYKNFDAAREGMREALCALGNGYFETRGAAAWPHADGVHYPGTYVAGGYNRLTTAIAGRAVENESLVNFPNWLALGLRIADGEWFDERNVTLLAYRQELDFRRGMLSRTMRFEDTRGRRGSLAERRFVSMADMHVAALELTLTAENWSGGVTLRSALDGRVVNAGAKLYRHFDNRHLAPLTAAADGEECIALGVRTSQSLLHVVERARTRAFVEGHPLTPPRAVTREHGYIAHEFTAELRQGETLRVEKVVGLHTSRDTAISEPGIAACKTVARAGSFEELLAAHTLAWKHLWRRFDIHMEPAGGRFALNVPMLARLNMLHLLQSASPNSIGLDIGVPARGWSGEAYEGHIFWDELFIFPFLNYRSPEITRSLLLYRYRRLPEARVAARAAGFRGAMFPWQSGSDGQEETQEMNFNDRSQRWIADNSFLQRHVGSAIARNVWQYYQVSGDVEFLHAYGAELILEIARFWSSIATFNAERARYEIRGVMGPDEFHDAYPDAERPGLDNNAYTNVMAVWVLRRGLDVLDCLPDIRRAELMRTLDISRDEIARWRDVSCRMFVPFHDGDIISQFEGYEKLAELDWARYRRRYGNIQRLELILEAENDSANRYQASKQTDVLMLFYLFSAEELREILERLGYRLNPESIPRNVAYYDCRSSHGSTLSQVVHAWVLARGNRRRAMRYFADALLSDVDDIQGGTTAEGIHLGAMAGTVDLMQRVATGIEATSEVLRMSPQLPPELTRLDMRLRYRGHTLDLHLRREALTIRSRERGAAPIRLGVKEQVVELAGGATYVFALAERRGIDSKPQEQRGSRDG